MSDKGTGSPKEKTRISIGFVVALLMLPLIFKPQGASAQSASAIDDSNVRPPVTRADLEIVKQAREILDSPSKWNRADNRECPAGAKTFSLYCALEKATIEVAGKFEHRGAALQGTRFVIDEIAANQNYNHRLMDYNNDPATTFADIQEVFGIVERLIVMRLKEAGSKGKAATVQSSAAPGRAQARPAVTKADIEIVKRARQILDSTSKWNRNDTQDCPVDANVFSLYCALVKAATEIDGRSGNGGAAMQEARLVIDENAPNSKTYGPRLKDFNNDPATSLADIQKLLQLVEERLAKRLAEAPGANK